MAGFFRKAMDYLGLSDDDGYGDYDPYEDQVAPPRRAAAPVVAPEPVLVHPRTSSVQAVPNMAVEGPSGGVVGVSVQARAQSGSVRTVTPVPSQRVHVVVPGSFGDAQDIGEHFRSSQPVVINLQGVERDLAKRIVDFSSGLAFALNGDMKKVADKVFLLTPTNVEVSSEEKRRLAERGLYTS